MPMLERRGVAAVAVAVVVAVLVVGAIGWALGRATAPDSTRNTTGAGSAATKTIDGIPVGVQHSRSGALAAADNYVAVASDSIVQDPKRYEQLVRRVYTPGYQAQALREGEQARAADPADVRAAAKGQKAVSTVGARRLDTYSSRDAATTTWLGGITWGPSTSEKPTQRWQLVETMLQWDGQRWLVVKIDAASRPAPSPTAVRFSEKSALSVATFDRELRGMAAPTYGGG